MTSAAITSGDDSSGPAPMGSTSGGDTAGGECRGDADCRDSSVPFCAEGACVSCSETAAPHAACAGADPDAPVCEGGACVACPSPDELCPGPAASCLCAACTDHSQCAAGAGCDLLTGACLPVDDVWYVDNNGRCPGEGSEAAPYCSIQAAVDAIAPGTGGTILLAPGAGIGYGEDVLIAEGRTVVMRGTASVPTVLNPAAEGAASILTVLEAETTVYLEHLRLRVSSEGPALAIDAGTVVGTALEVAQSAGGGIAVTGAGHVQLTNSMVGAGTFGPIAVSLTEASTADILYSSLVGGAAPALECVDGGEVTVRNSILLRFPGGTEGVNCPTAALTACATEADVGDLSFGQGWFASTPGADYHLTPDGAATFADYAVWNSGDPLTDIDGDPRPGVDGAPDFPGADVPQ